MPNAALPLPTLPGPVHIGCAGWGLPSALRQHFACDGTQLQRYASRLHACEINSSFYRPHARETYGRWAESVPTRFRFSVKLPRAITHERRLEGCEDLLDEFLAAATGLGARLGCLLMQLPPSFAFEPQAAGFLEALRARWPGAVAAEPRHASWFTPQANDLLARFRIARALADPVRFPEGAWPGGWPGLVYLRLHGSPRMYYSAYPPDLLAGLARRIALAARDGTTVWCMFDNTAAGAAADNALALQREWDKEQE